jgi:hypothetical protein
MKPVCENVVRVTVVYVVVYVRIRSVYKHVGDCGGKAWRV